MPGRALKTRQRAREGEFFKVGTGEKDGEGLPFRISRRRSIMERSQCTPRRIQDKTKYYYCNFQPAGAGTVSACAWTSSANKPKPFWRLSRMSLKRRAFPQTCLKSNWLHVRAFLKPTSASLRKIFAVLRLKPSKEFRLLSTRLPRG